MRNVALITRRPETTSEPPTSPVRPTVLSLIPRAVSATRKPAVPEETVQVPASGPAGACAAVPGSASGGSVGWNLMNAQVASTIRASRAVRPSSSRRGQRRLRVASGTTWNTG